MLLTKIYYFKTKTNLFLLFIILNFKFLFSSFYKLLKMMKKFHVKKF